MRHLIVLLLLAAAALAADGAPPIIVPRSAGPAPVADGVIGQGEYRGLYVDARTGITVHWQADSAALYCALRSPGKGWLAIGFGSTGMKGAVMAFALAGPDGAWVVEEHAGKAFYRHARADSSRLAGSAALSDGRTMMEFSLPLRLANGAVISAAAPLPFILAYHKDRAGGGKHSKRSSGTMVLEAGARP
ncbi:MAG: DOMON domain-containing protein [Candidatus Edwardsbacteria bacterium]|jgi:hypothetical protein|nr:DOMON domain-containing protein [Candidatus Edwardsbacteria bacterium]